MQRGVKWGEILTGTRAELKEFFQKKLWRNSFEATKAYQLKKGFLCVELGFSFENPNRPIDAQLDAIDAFGQVHFLNIESIKNADRLGVFVEGDTTELMPQINLRMAVMYIHVLPENVYDIAEAFSSTTLNLAEQAHAKNSTSVPEQRAA